MPGSNAKLNSRRLLSFAFASADLFLEIDASSHIRFALGAGERVAGTHESKLPGLNWRELVAPEDHAMVAALLASMEGAERRGPVAVRIAREQRVGPPVMLCAFRLPPSEMTSLALSLSYPERVATDGGLFDADTFLDEAERIFTRAGADGADMGLSLVDLPGLEAARAGLDAKAAADLDRDLVGALRSQA